MAAMRGKERPAAVAWQLRRLRREKGVSQTALSEASGVAQKSISEIESGRRRPQLATLDKLADALGVDVAELTGETPAAPLPEDASSWVLAGTNTMFARRVRKARIQTLLGSVLPLLNATIGAAKEVGDDETKAFAMERWRLAVAEWRDRGLLRPGPEEPRGRRPKKKRPGARDGESLPSEAGDAQADTA